LHIYQYTSKIPKDNQFVDENIAVFGAVVSTSEESDGCEVDEVAKAARSLNAKVEMRGGSAARPSPRRSTF